MSDENTCDIYEVSEWRNLTAERQFTVLYLF